jgi:hypothetical protein
MLVLPFSLLNAINERTSPVVLNFIENFIESLQRFVADSIEAS